MAFHGSKEQSKLRTADLFLRQAEAAAGADPKVPASLMTGDRLITLAAVLSAKGYRSTPTYLSVVAKRSRKLWPEAERHTELIKELSTAAMRNLGPTARRDPVPL